MFYILYIVIVDLWNVNKISNIKYTQILQSFLYLRNVLALWYSLKYNVIVASKKLQPNLHHFS